MLSPARMLLVSFLCSGRLRQPVFRVFFRKGPGRGGAGGGIGYVWPSAGCGLALARSLAPQFGLCAPSARRERTSTPMPMAREWRCDAPTSRRACGCAIWPLRAVTTCTSRGRPQQPTAHTTTRTLPNTGRFRPRQYVPAGRVRQRLRLSCTRAHSHGHTVPSRD